jgi:hypothetical protein
MRATLCPASDKFLSGDMVSPFASQGQTASFADLFQPGKRQRKKFKELFWQATKRPVMLF